MNEAKTTIYDFLGRGLLTEAALDRAGRRRPALAGYTDDEVAADLSIGLLDETLVEEARKMATVYAAIAAWENSVRKLVSTVLLEEFGENWWATHVAQAIRDNAEKRKQDEEKTRWHAQRGEDLIYYTELGDLVKTIRKNENWPKFEPFLGDQDWVSTIFDSVEHSRNVIMHSGTLTQSDVQRLGIHLRDWVAQVGS